MKKSIYQEINVVYQAGQEIYWTGRKPNPNLENQYWHQEIELIDMHNINKHKNIDIALLGYVCDEGVRRNLGRVGAAQGPKTLRKYLAKLPIHFEGKRVADVGGIICIEEDMESCQQALTDTISLLISQQIFPIVMGGGHDMAYGHFMGIRNALKSITKNKIGIINFDAHFDLRPVEEKSNSGTPFYQIISELQETDESIDYFAIGIQQQSNTKELFEIAKNKQVSYVMNYDCESSSEEVKVLQKKLLPFINSNDYLYITIDMDGFSAAYAPGVSAPSSLGFTPSFIFKMLRFLFETKKVISCDIAELNPVLDSDNQTARLAAKLLDFIVMHK